MVNQGTGFLYGWGGVGISGSDSIPNEITGLLFSGIQAGPNFNTAILITPLVIPPQPITPRSPDLLQISFQLLHNGGVNYENNAGISKISLFSTFSGSGSSPFVSGSDFQNNIYLGTFGGQNQTLKEIAAVSLGATLGTGSGVYKYPSDTFLNIDKNKRFYKSGDSWTEYFGEFSKYNFTGFSGADAGIVLNDLGSEPLETPPEIENLNLYNINYGTKESFLSGSLVKQKILIQSLSNSAPIVEVKSPLQKKAWASYDTFTGMVNNTRNVFSYAIDVVGKLETKKGMLLIGGTEVSPFEYLKKLAFPTFVTGFESSFRDYIGFCFNREDCPDPSQLPEDATECWTGDNITGIEYKLFLSGIIGQYSGKKESESFDGVSNLSISSGVTIENLFYYQTGNLFYNSFFTGDSFEFQLYPFNYTGLYKEYHLGNDPLYPSTGFKLTFPNDFTGIDDLINVLNGRLYEDKSIQLWYPYLCLSGQSQGIYKTGSLVFFEKDLSIPTGSQNYNNIIKFKSLRNNANGFSYKLNLVNRDEYVKNLEKNHVRKGLSYLIPNVIELQGLTGSQWIILDRHSGIYHDLTGIIENKILDVIVSDEILLNEDVVYAETGVKEEITEDFEEIFLSGGFKTLNQFQKINKSQGPAFCAQSSGIQNIYVVQPTGWPQGFNPCKEPPSPAGGEKEEKQEEKEEGLGSGIKPIEAKLYIARTGWVLNPSGPYLTCLTAPDYKHESIQFSGYRVVLRDFSGLKLGPETFYLQQTSDIYISTINLFSLRSDNIPVLTGDAKCLIGANYTVDVQDVVAKNFDTNFNYVIGSEDQKGVYKALNQIQTYTPTSLERNISFVNSSGKIVGDLTGLVNGLFSGTGFISHTFGNRYFYDPSTQQISFKKDFSNFVTGSGILSGSAIAIKDFIINQELFFGGRLTTPPQYSELISGGLFTGLLTGINYIENNITGLFILSGYISGISNSGYFIFSTGVTGSGVYVNEDNYPFYPFPTGYKQASGTIFINYNRIQNFDLLSINNTSISYHSNTGAYFAPDYFYNTDSLITTINNSPNLFNCTGIKLSNTGILLIANDFNLGVEGNNIIITSNGSGIILSSNSLTGGKTFYPRLYPTTIFSGTANGFGIATGFYYEKASGSITGNVPTFTGVRTFTGVWGLQTGQDFDFISFLGNNLLSGNSKYFNTGTFIDETNLLQILVQYSNQLNTDENDAIDVANIKIKDLNYNLLFPTGSPTNTGTYNFRITGIKNL
jgi:hypothetical protein